MKSKKVVPDKLSRILADNSPAWSSLTEPNDQRRAMRQARRIEREIGWPVGSLLNYADFPPPPPTPAELAAREAVWRAERVRIEEELARQQEDRAKTFAEILGPYLKDEPTGKLGLVILEDLDKAGWLLYNEFEYPDD